MPSITRRLKPTAEHESSRVHIRAHDVVTCIAGEAVARLIPISIGWPGRRTGEFCYAEGGEPTWNPPALKRTLQYVNSHRAQPTPFGA